MVNSRDTTWVAQPVEFTYLVLPLIKRLFMQYLVVIEKDGWYQVARRGSHRQFKHPKKSGRVTVPDHGRNKDLAKGTESSILKQAGLK